MSDEEKEEREEKKEKGEKGPKKKFEVKKWNAVALWAWGKNFFFFLLFSFLNFHF